MNQAQMNKQVHPSQNLSRTHVPNIHCPLEKTLAHENSAL